jgi:hypothetical protein
MTHPLVLGLFEAPSAAATAARELRRLGVPRDHVSIVARNHDEEGELAREAGASPGSEIEDSWLASRFGELSAHLLAAIAVVLPGVGPIVAGGPLAAGLGEAAGHLAGGVARMLERAGVSPDTAEAWEDRIRMGAVLVGVHLTPGSSIDAEAAMRQAGASYVTAGNWRD